MKKLLITALFVLSGSLFSIFWQSCSDPCGVDGPIYFKASNFNINKAKISDVETLDANEVQYYKYEINLNNEIVDYDSVALLLTYEVNNIAQTPFSTSAAYACSPATLYPQIVECNITANKSYGGKAAGSNLNEFFQAHPYLQKNGITLSNLGENEINLSGQQLMITLNTPPDDEDNYNFTFQLTFENEETIEITVEDVKIKP
jgi:hypothetical protein